MTTTELIDYLSQASGIERREVVAILIGSSAVAIQELSANRPFQLPHIGTLSLAEDGSGIQFKADDALAACVTRSPINPNADISEDPLGR